MDPALLVAGVYSRPVLVLPHGSTASSDTGARPGPSSSAVHSREQHCRSFEQSSGELFPGSGHRIQSPRRHTQCLPEDITSLRCEGFGFRDASGGNFFSAAFNSTIEALPLSVQKRHKGSEQNAAWTRDSWQMADRYLENRSYAAPEGGPRGRLRVCGTALIQGRSCGLRRRV